MARLIRDLTEMLLCGPYEEEAARERILAAVQVIQPPEITPISGTRWVRPLIRKVFRRFPNSRLRPLRAQLRRFLASDDGLGSKAPFLESCILLQSAELVRPTFAPLRPEFGEWGLPELTTTGELARWLEVSPEELDWLSARYRHTHRETRYDVHILTSRSGKRRLIEAPSAPLKRVQRVLLEEILTRIPPHSAARGFREGMNVLNHAQPHCGQSVVWKLDLGNFFLSIPATRVLGLFRTCGYPEHVARALTGLTTSRIDRQQLSSLGDQLDRSSQMELGRLATEWHLPQGAPTSPALANLIAWKLDRRLNALAEKFGANYTRYADDLAFSGDRAFHRRLARFRIWALAIITDEGFLIRSRKSRSMPASHRQEVTGVVINQRPNLVRSEYKQLHAILHNCRVHGYESQNREGHPHFLDHLRGRVAWVTQLNEPRGRKLLAMLDQIPTSGG